MTDIQSDKSYYYGISLTIYSIVLISGHFDEWFWKYMSCFGIGLIACHLQFLLIKQDRGISVGNGCYQWVRNGCEIVEYIVLFCV